jgi:hypothetical protein
MTLLYLLLLDQFCSAVAIFSFLIVLQRMGKKACRYINSIAGRILRRNRSYVKSVAMGINRINERTKEGLQKCVSSD